LLILWQTRNLLARSVSRARLFDEERNETAVVQDEEPETGLGRWLALAGFRSPSAVGVFLALELSAGIAGGLVIVGMYAIALPARAERAVAGVPGGIGDLFLPLVYIAPWLIWILLMSLPWLMVRRARRLRIQQIEQDLSVTLDLLATLCEAGLGFDAALDRVLASQPADRVLAREFRGFQVELLSGRARVQALRRLSRRIDVPSMSMVVSALVQATQIGSGVADVLRRQAEDLRNRRREQANTFAAALPVKLLFPLVICFLPGLFVVTLGPVFHQFFQFADTIIRTRGQ
jgi:tight adherence protein C